MDIFWAIFKTARPRQWVKNISLMAALIFSGLLYTPGSLVKVIEAIVIFSILASSVYIFNDIIDVNKDREHPFKRKRPIASGDLAIHKAMIAMIGGWFVGIVWAYQLNFFFFLTCVAYVIVQFAYSLWLKNVWHKCFVTFLQ